MLLEGAGVMLLPLWIFFMWPPTDAVDTPEPFVVKDDPEDTCVREDAELFLVKDE